MSGALRGLVIAAVVLAGCGPGKPSDAETGGAARTDGGDPNTPSSGTEPEGDRDPDRVRKRECVAALTAASDPRVHALMRSLCAEWVEQRVPGLAVAVVEAGKPAIHVELGVRCFGRPEPVDASTAFRIGSVSKPVTAALALGLVAEGSLGLDRSAASIPAFAGQAGLPTPRLDALLGHRSGLGEIDPGILVELDGAWLPALARSPAAGSPGEYHYSNSGYALVGAMLEQAAGHDYAELVTTRIAEPLGLARLTADPTRANSACGHLAHDVDRHPIEVREDLEFMPGDPSWMLPAGGLLSSATDLARFALAIGSEQLPGSAAMLEPGEPLPPTRARPGHADERYGFGLRSWQLDSDTRAYGHTGNNVSFISKMLFVPGRRAIVILANTGVDLPATTAAAEALLGG